MVWRGMNNRDNNVDDGGVVEGNKWQYEGRCKQSSFIYLFIFIFKILKQWMNNGDDEVDNRGT
jgi:hypothetical protein